MKGKDIVSRKEREVLNQQRGISVSERGIVIPVDGKPIRPINLVYLLIDTSDSMGNSDKLPQAKRGALRFAKDSLHKGYLTGLIQFSSSVIHLLEPQSSLDFLAEKLGELEAGGSTNMVGAIQLAVQKLEGRTGRRVIVLVTDGRATEGEPSPTEATLKMANKAKNEGIDIITIGTDDADEGFLREIASRADLSVYVPRDQLEQGIRSTVKMLPNSLTEQR